MIYHDLTDNEFEKLLKEREKARKMMKKWSNRIDELDNIICENCPHVETSTTTKGYEAGYDYVAEYHTIKKCLVCNKELEYKIERGNSFS